MSIMGISTIIINRTKLIVRSKELYIYIIGFPLIFLLIYGGLAGVYYPETSPISIGYLSMDHGAVVSIGNNTYSTNYSESFYSYLRELTYENTSIKVFNIANISDTEKAEKLVSRLQISAVIVIPEDFSESLKIFSESFTKNTLLPILVREANEAFEEGNYDLGSRYLAALDELNNLPNTTKTIAVRIIGDPTNAQSMRVYELTWRYLVEFAFTESSRFLERYTNYLSEKYNITIELNSENITTSATVFSVGFQRIGSEGGLKESFFRAYYSVLIPGQIIQTIMMATISAMEVIHSERDRGLLDRIRLTRLSPYEYILSILAVWGIIAIFQAAILLGISLALGFVKVVGTLAHYLVSLVIIVLSGIITAEIGLLLASLIRRKEVTGFVLALIITLSLFIAGYFPIRNPVLGNFMGYQFTLLDLVPWRCAVMGLRKVLMLPNIFGPLDAIPELVLLIIWALIYGIVSSITFSTKLLRKLE